MTRYTDEFRAGTVLLLEGAGYPDRKGALAEVALNVGVPAMTISRWFRASQNPPPNKMVTEKRLELIEVIRNEIYAVAGDFSEARPDADYKTLVTGFAILVDKLQLLDGKATERTEIVDDRLTDDERANKIAALLDAARARQDGRSTDDKYIQ